jgi:RecA/RadA recombinase
MFVLFLTPAPNKEVPKRLYYVDGKVFEDELENALQVETREEAMEIQSKEQESYDLQIISLDDARTWVEKQKRGE